MMRRLFPLWVLLLTFAIYGAQVAYFYPLLPDRLATHFGPHGNPDGWMSKDGFLSFYAAFLALMWAFISGLAFFMGRLPNDQINLPHKDYWLAPERRAFTLLYVREHMLRLGAVLQIFLLVMAQSIFQANRLPEPRLSGIFAPLTFLFLVYVVFWTLSLTRRFSKIPE